MVFAGDQVEILGDVAAWASSDSYLRFFCRRCGSRTYAQNTGADGATEIELSLGSFAAIGWFAPQYESWVARREPWLTPLAGPQFLHDRAAPTS